MELFDRDERDQIRQGLIDFMARYQLGTIRMSKAIARFVNDDIPVKTLERFVKGLVRTDDTMVRYYRDYLQANSSKQAPQPTMAPPASFPEPGSPQPDIIRDHLHWAQFEGPRRLHAAIAANDLPAVKAIVEAGDIGWFPNEQGLKPTAHAAAAGASEEMSDYLREHEPAEADPEI